MSAKPTNVPTREWGGKACKAEMKRIRSTDRRASISEGADSSDWSMADLAAEVAAEIATESANEF
tara:strand:- start:701 stop:895 length:195 start_codon:yes stop_codon:yes gene_type:complete